MMTYLPPDMKGLRKYNAILIVSKKFKLRSVSLSLKIEEVSILEEFKEEFMKSTVNAPYLPTLRVLSLGIPKIDSANSAPTPHSLKDQLVLRAE